MVAAYFAPCTSLMVEKGLTYQKCNIAESYYRHINSSKKSSDETEI
jgi:hypothetical protein